MPNSVSYLTQHLALLKKEYEYERENFRRETTAMPVGRKIKRGICWYPLNIGRSYYNSLNQLVVEVFRTEDKEIEHSFEYGKPICFFALDASDNPRFFKFRSTVGYVDDDRMVAVIPDSEALAALQGTARLGVQLFFDETSYRLMFSALEAAIRAKNNRMAELREIFHGTVRPAKTSALPVAFPWLNTSQQEAVNEALWAKDVAIIHGPPGTGKTTTLVETVYEILRRENQVLVCAQSNMAVDWISEKISDRGINVLRIGNPTRVNDKMLSFTYERRFESHPDYPQLWGIRRAIRELRAHRRRGDDRWHQRMESLKGRAAEIELRINAELFGEARVIASTLTGSASRLLEGMKFGTLFIDEAAQALEAACWIAIRRAGRVVLAGDHCQLPPTVKSIGAMRGGLGRTLMERIVELHPSAVTLLRMQYRMNDDIMRFSSRWFYGGRVESAPEVRHRGILDLDIPMTWIDTSQMAAAAPGEADSEANPFREEFVGESFGRINKAEAELTLATLDDYFNRIGRQRIVDERIDVGIISPYRAQVQYLRHLISRRDSLKPMRRSISVNTVDGFQGQERDIILISLVRSNDSGEIGFLRDLRRMNVAITRARMKLIILGDVPTMTRHPFYRQLWEYIEGLKAACRQQ